jgi:hypothetical protein
MEHNPRHCILNSLPSGNVGLRIIAFVFLIAISPSSSLFSQSAEHLQYIVVTTAHTPMALLQNQEEAWNMAPKIVWGPKPFTTEFQALWNRQGLFLRFNAMDTQPWHTMKNRDDHLWEEEVVEIFIDPDGSRVNYMELEINPANVICDVIMRRTWPNKLSDMSWNFKGLKSEVFPISAADEKRIGWRSLFFLPWNGFRTLPAAKRIMLPPNVGDQWHFNLFRIKRPGGKGDPEKDVIYAAWSPTQEPSFHVPRAFRPMIFSK